MTNEEIVAEIQNGQTERLTELYNKNKGLLVKLAKQFSWGGEIDDLMQSGYIGLHTAALTFYPESSDASFCTFAAVCIKSEMLKFCRSNTTVVIPRHTQDDLRKLQKSTGSFEIEIGHSPTDRDLCSLMGCSMDELQSLKTAELTPTSIDTPISEDLTLADTIEAADNTETAIENVEREQLRAALLDEIETLPEDQQTALKNRYWHGKSFAETGEKLTHDKAIRELRKAHHTKSLRPFLAYDRCIRGTSLTLFKQTFTSAVERTVLHRVGRNVIKPAE